MAILNRYISYGLAEVISGYSNAVDNVSLFLAEKVLIDSFINSLALISVVRMDSKGDLLRPVVADILDNHLGS
jgi:hypothetical protein